MEPAAAERWARDFLVSVGFVPTIHETPWVVDAKPTIVYEADQETASIELLEDAPGSVAVRIGVWHGPG
jgi:hypothetical protein